MMMVLAHLLQGTLVNVSKDSRWLSAQVVVRSVRRMIALVPLVARVALALI